jgi:hypothetical protein
MQDLNDNLEAQQVSLSQNQPAAINNVSPASEISNSTSGIAAAAASNDVYSSSVSIGRIVDAGLLTNSAGALANLTPSTVDSIQRFGIKPVTSQPVLSGASVNIDKLNIGEKITAQVMIDESQKVQSASPKDSKQASIVNNYYSAGVMVLAPDTSSHDSKPIKINVAGTEAEKQDPVQDAANEEKQMLPLQALIISNAVDIRQLAIREEFRVSLGECLTYAQRAKGFNYLSCFVSFIPGDNLYDQCSQELCEDLRAAGIDVLLSSSLMAYGQDAAAHAEMLMDKKTNFVIIIGTPLLLNTYKLGGSDTLEMRLINYIVRQSHERSSKIIPILLAGSEESALPPLLRQKNCYDLTRQNYYSEIFRLVREINGFNPQDQEFAKIITKFWLTVNQINTLAVENMQYTYCLNVKEKLRKRQEEARLRAQQRLTSLLTRVVGEAKQSQESLPSPLPPLSLSSQQSNFFRQPRVLLDNKNIARGIIINFYLQRAAIHLPVFNRAQPIAQSFINLAIVSQQEQEIKMDDYQSGVRPFSQEDLSLAHRCIKPKQLFTLDNTPASTAQERYGIAGKAGIGKSTLCHFICQQWAIQELGQSYYIVFWVPLRHLVNYHAKYQNTIDEHDLAEFLFYVFRQEDKSNGTANLTIEQLYQLLISSEKKFFVLDGFDEVAHLFRHQTLQAKLLHLLLNMQFYLLTSRPGYTARANLICDSQYEIVGFVSDDIPHYVERIYKLNLRPDEQGRQLVELLRGNRRLWGAAHVPIMLALICSIFINTRDYEKYRLNANITEIYQKVLFNMQIQYLENQWQVPDGVADWDVNTIIKYCDPVMFFLEELAFQATLDGALIISAELIRQVLQNHKVSLDAHVAEVAKLFGEGQKNIELIKNRLVKLIARAGFLIPLAKAVNEQDQEYYFIHPTFQTLFAARYLARQFKEQAINLTELLLQHKFNPMFNGLWSFIAGLLQADSDLSHLQGYIDLILKEPHNLVAVSEGALLFEICNEISPNIKFKQREAISQFYLNWFLFAINDNSPSRSMVGPFARNIELSRLVNEPLVQTVIHDTLQQADDYTKYHIAYSMADLRIINAEITHYLIEGFTLNDKRKRLQALGILQNAARVYPEMLVSLQAALSHPHLKVRLHTSGTLLLINHETPLAVKTLLTIFSSFQFKFRHNEEGEEQSIFQQLLERLYQNRSKPLSKEMRELLELALKSPGFYSSFGWSRGNTDHFKHGVLIALLLTYPVSPPKEIIGHIKALAFHNANFWREWSARQLLNELARPESPIATDALNILKELALNDSDAHVRTVALNVLIEELNIHDKEVLEAFRRTRNVYASPINMSAHALQIIQEITDLSESIEATGQTLRNSSNDQDKINAIKYITKRIEIKADEVEKAFIILHDIVTNSAESEAVKIQAINTLVSLASQYHNFSQNVLNIIREYLLSDATIDKSLPALELSRLRQHSTEVLELYEQYIQQPNYQLSIINSLKILYSSSPTALHPILELIRNLISTPTLAIDTLIALLDVLAAIGAWLGRDPGNHYTYILGIFKLLVKHPNARMLDAEKVVKSVIESRPLDTQLGIPIMRIAIKSQRDHWEIFRLFIVNKYTDRLKEKISPQFEDYLSVCWDDLKDLPFLEILISPRELFNIYFNTNNQRLAHFLATLCVQERLGATLFNNKLYIKEFSSKEPIIIDISTHFEKIIQLRTIATNMQGIPIVILQTFMGGLKDNINKSDTLPKQLTPRSLVSNRLFYQFDAEHYLYLGDGCLLKQQRLQAVERWLKVLEFNAEYEPAIERLANHYLSVNDLDNAIAFHSKLVQVKQNDKHGAYHNLACCYFARATSSNNSEDYQHARQAFETGIKQCRAINIITEFANMLVHLKDYQAAKDQLESIVTKTHNDELYYGMSEKLNLPPVMREELSAHNESLTIRAITYAYYLLFLCYMATSQDTKANALLHNFKNDVDKTPSAIGYSLLGYAYQTLKNYQEALESFTLAKQYKSPYSLADQNIEQIRKRLNEAPRMSI